MKTLTFLGAPSNLPHWATPTDANKILTKGATYEVEHVEIHRFHTKVKLKGTEGWFNLIHFRQNP